MPPPRPRRGGAHLHRLRWPQVRAEVEAPSDRELQARFTAAWTACDSWYRDEDGRVVADWPGDIWASTWSARAPSNLAEYVFSP